ncbi:MAG: hypothetical protein HYS04_05515, partial [Acidobacteria bacterium]|nr:hypothetical protein [Acidobacteriota bacterium]
ARVIAGGGSAGAACAAMAALNDTLDARDEDRSVSSRPDALVLYNPPMEIPARIWEGSSAPRNEYEKLAAAASPNTYIRKGAPPAIMFFGTADPLLEPARKYVREAHALDNRVELFLARDQRHGFFNDNPADYSWHASVLWITDRFLTSLGYLDGRPTKRFYGPRARPAAARRPRPHGCPPACGRIAILSTPRLRKRS